MIPKRAAPIDGVDIKRFSLRSLRSQIAVVSQSTFLFNDTIRANIAYGGPGKSMDEIVVAARQATLTTSSSLAGPL